MGTGTKEMIAGSDRDRAEACHDIYSLIEMGDTESLRKMIEGGADVNASDFLVEWTPLHLAVFSNSGEAARILLSYGANVNARDRMHNTPLHWAILMKRPRELLELLISSGADVNAQGNGGRTPLYHAMMNQQGGVIELLAAHGASE